MSRSEAVAQGLTTRTFVAARITDWPSSSPFPLVEVRQSLGPTGDIEAGTAALLAGEGVKDEDFGLEVRGSILGRAHCVVTSCSAVHLKAQWLDCNNLWLACVWPSLWAAYRIHTVWLIHNTSARTCVPGVCLLAQGALEHLPC